MEEEQRKRVEREKGETGRDDLVQRSEMLRELLWIAVKENKALATSDALQVAPKERQVRTPKEPYASQKRPTHPKRSLRTPKEPYTPKRALLTPKEPYAPQKNPTHHKRALIIPKEPYTSPKSPAQAQEALCMPKEP